MTFRLRAVALPDEEWVDLSIDGDRLRMDAADEAEVVVDGGWVISGLVDVHTHPGAEQPGDPLDPDLLRRHGHEHVAGGVTLIRAPGSADRLPAWFGEEPDLPRVQSAGHWLARPGQFFDGWGRKVPDTDLPDAAAEEALASTGWCKVVVDWGPEDEVLPADVLAEVVRRVHAVGGRVAVHSQNAGGGLAAVEAGVDTLEHGMHLDPGLLDRMASQGTALVPTFTPFENGIEHARSAPPNPRRDWFVSGYERHGPLTAAAHEAGVTVLAGTDSSPHGRVRDEIRLLAAAGLPADVALGAGAWTARRFLGLPGIEEGAPADLVVYDEDPRKDLAVLDAPSRIILRGQIVR